jgi:hypothetical protein
MIPVKADRIKIRIGNFWETPALHVLLTREDDVIVARCLDFTLSSHGENEKDALKALGDAVKEYIISAVENRAVDTAFDPAYEKYWIMYNKLEMMQTINNLKDSVKKSFKSVSNEAIYQSSAEIEYA